MDTNEKTGMKIDNNKLKQLRLEKSWSQEKLATQADITLRTVQRVESEGYSSLRSLESLAKALESEPNEFIMESDLVVTKNLPQLSNQHDLWLMLVAIIVCSLFIQTYGSITKMTLPAIIMLSYLPLCFISFLILATQYPLEKYRKIIYLSIIPIGIIFGPSVPFLLNKITMMVLCVIMYETSNKAGAFFRARATKGRNYT